MENTINLANLKTRLQQIGAIRPEAWEMILHLHHYKCIATNESFIREHGCLTYVAEGLLKEYNAHKRTRATIVNFIGKEQWLLTRRHNQHHYLKASLPTQVMYWTYRDLTQLYHSFPELTEIYHMLCESYEIKVDYRSWMIEPSAGQVRILRFREVFHKELKYLKKKDMANYLQITYSHFIHLYNETIK